MDYEETMVENEDFDTEADDTLPEGIEEEDESEEEDLTSIDDGEESEEEEQAEDEPQEQQATEPGWIKQRISKAVNKAVAAALAQQQAEFDKQMAPLREKMLNDEARELVRQGEFKSLDRAKEYLQLKQGVAPQAPAVQQQPRNDQGQYAPKEDPVMATRIDMLAHQADTIRDEMGIDVIDAMNQDEDIKDAIKNGEMDFYDVAKMMSQPKSRRAPSPMRSPNGASGVNNNSIMSMSDEQFARMEKKISEGARFTLR